MNKVQEQLLDNMRDSITTALMRKEISEDKSRELFNQINLLEMLIGGGDEQITPGCSA